MVTLACECGDFRHVPNVTCQPPPPLDVKHDANLFVNAPSVIYLFSFLYTGTAFMVFAQFCGRLVQQYMACVVDSLGL